MKRKPTKAKKARKLWRKRAFRTLVQTATRAVTRPHGGGAA